MSIYVETVVRSAVDDVWTHTQTPELHERWDLRFSRIQYLATPARGEPQRFLYSTRIGFGLEISGEGETVGQHSAADGSRSSALMFSSAQAWSLIHHGRGYWKYVPTEDGVRFFTGYDYQVRFGALGAAFDRLVFRPLMGWATAWSFDRLRLWLERRIDPSEAARSAAVHFIARVALAGIFFYQGVIPKLMARHADELAILTNAGISDASAPAVVVALGLAEVMFGTALLTAWCRRWPAWVCVAAMPIATLAVAINSHAYLTAAFNPLSLNLAVAALAVIDLIVLDRVPSAARCRRTARREEP